MDPVDDPAANDSATDDSNTERPAKSAQAKLSTHPPRIPVCYSHVIMLSPDHLADNWTSPIYIFFRRTPRIEYVDSRQVHVFECAASHCKGKHGRDVRRFLNTGNAKLTSNLHRHAKTCWGNEAVSAADNTKDLDGACIVLAKSGLKRDGSITSAFECIGKEKVTYSHCQYTYTQTRYVVCITSLGKCTI